MQTEVNQPVSEQLAWISLNPASNSSVQRSRKSKRKLNISAVLPASNQDSASSSFLYLKPLSERTRIKGRAVLSKACSNVTLKVSPLNQPGQAVSTGQTLQLTQTSPLDLNLDSAGASYLLLEASHAPISSGTEQCLFKVNNLVVSSQ